MKILIDGVTFEFVNKIRQMARLSDFQKIKVSLGGVEFEAYIVAVSGGGDGPLCVELRPA